MGDGDISELARNQGRDKARSLIEDQLNRPPQSESTNGQEDLTWSESLVLGMCTSSQLLTLDIPPRVAILGDWLFEGDLGFIFAQRGVGKTWLALDIAHGIAQLKDVGPWETQAQRKCLYLDGEMPPADIKKRDYALGKAAENLTYVNHEILFERTGKVMNLADKDFQRTVLERCKQDNFSVLFLDNLSCLASGVNENDPMDWEKLLPWLLELRRAHITVIFIAHAGRNNQMRGHSKREDPAFWIIRLDAPLEVNETKKGAHFISRFTKWRSIQKPATYQWSYTPAGPNNEDICVQYKTAAPIDLFRYLIESGLETATDLAEEMAVSKGYVSQLATKAKNDGWLEIENRRYRIKDT
jgi:RecA-family ATPase